MRSRCPKVTDFGASKAVAPAWVTTAALMLCFMGCLWPRMSSYVEGGRFWAEEGSIFFAPIRASGFKALTFLYNGHLELATNITVWLATLVSFESAPLVTTYAALAQMCVPILLVVHYRRELGIGLLPTIGFLVIVAGLPQMPEVLANATCLHFHTLLLAGVIAILPLSVIEGRRARWVFRGILTWAGLAGVPPNFLAPVFLGLALYQRSSERWIQFGLLSVTATVQASLLIMNWEAVLARNPQNVPLLAWLAFDAQVIVAPLFGVAAGGRLSEVLKSGLRGEVGALMFAIWLSAPLAATAAVWWRRREPSVWALSSAALITTLLSVSFALLEDKTHLISVDKAPRYFYVPGVLWFLLVAKSVSTACSQPSGDKVGQNQSLGVILAVYLTSCAVMSFFFSPPPFYTSGKPWRTALRQARETGASTVEIWPQGWKMPLPMDRP